MSCRIPPHCRRPLEVVGASGMASPVVDGGNRGIKSLGLDSKCTSLRTTMMWDVDADASDVDVDVDVDVEGYEDVVNSSPPAPNMETDVFLLSTERSSGTRSTTSHVSEWFA